MERESTQLVRRQKATEKATKKWQGHRHTTEDLPGLIEGKGQSTRASHALATTKGIMVPGTERTMNADWASAFSLQ
jgi:hypothetical protein